MSSMRQLHQKRHVEELTFQADFVFNFGAKGQVLRGFLTGLSNSMAFNRSSKAAPKMQSVFYKSMLKKAQGVFRAESDYAAMVAPSRLLS